MQRTSDINCEENDSIYEVPPPSIRSSIPVMPTQSPLPEPTSPPPQLMPKKGSSFRFSSALLDPKPASDSPRPAPRQKKSDQRTSSMFVESNGSHIDHQQQKNTDSNHITLISSPPPSPHARPVPKPRTRSAPSTRTSPLLKTTKPNSFPQIGTVKEDTNSESHCNPPSDSEARWNLPPDPDSLEMMLNEEMDKKYGFQPDRNSDPNSKCEETTDQPGQTGLYVNKDVINALKKPEKPDTLWNNSAASLSQKTMSPSSSIHHETVSVKQFANKNTTGVGLGSLPSSASHNTSGKPCINIGSQLGESSTDDPSHSLSSSQKYMQFDFSDLDPLCQKNWSSEPTDNQDDSPDLSPDHYERPDEVLATTPGRYSLRSPHFDPPIAPPPPFPREQNRVPEIKAPPLPPRPTENIPDTHLDQSSSFAQDIFDGVVAAEFTPREDMNDPFEGTNFDDVCHKFNSSAKVIEEPELPQRMPLIPDANPSPVTDPERISRFVIPPPGSVVREPDDQFSREYKLAGEVSSDSEDQDVQHPGGRAWQDSHVGQQVAEPMSPRKNSRDGYLNKQGGHNANRGWRRRWVVFNGKNLSYYTDNTSQVSIRIIPVKCMVKVEQDIKDSDFRFKLHTTLKNRVFLFSSDTLADCLNWALTLDVSILEYQKQKVEEASLEKPDKEGFFKIDSFSRKYYVTIIGPILQYYHSFEEYQLGSPIHQIDMKLASVKVKERKKFKLQLSTHYHYFELTFENDPEMQQWRMAMEDSIAEGLSDDTVLEKVYNNLSNRNCADCGAPDPHWASINLGIVVCKNCAGVHRTFDYRISKIRSLRMDTRVWTPSLIELMVTIGNANANAFWEFQLPDGVKADPADTMDKRKEYITKKYIGKKFSNLHALCSMGSAALGKELVTTASSDNVLETMKILFSGADVLFRIGTGQTAYDVAKENGQRLIMELLYQNSGDPQSQVENTRDENRLREDIRMQGFLNKPGPNGRTFEKRWCLLEHGCLTYYLNEKSTTFKGSIDRKDMYMIQAVESDRIGYHFELGTCMKENRTFIFSSDCKEDAGDWIRTIAKLMAPVAVMENVGMIDIKFAGIAYLRESLSEEWRQTFLIYSWRGLYYMNKDLKLDYLDLRKASGIKMLSSNEGFQKQGPFFIISSTGRSVYVQALLPRDTDKMFTALVMAYTRSGPYLNDQALTTDNVPVIVDRCITHISKFGLREKGIYRQAGQQSRVQALLDEFKKDAYAVSLNDYTVDEVANAVKKFLRELDDSVFERRHYGAWIEIAGYQDESIRITKYQQLLDKMPEVNRQTLKRIIQHLKQVAQHQEENSMDLKNLATCFAPSLLRTHLDQLQMSDSSSREIKIVLDIMQHSDDLFQVGENEKGVEDKMSEMLEKIKRANLKSAEATSAGIPIITDVYLMDYNSTACENFTITDDKTVAVAIKEAVDKFRRIDRNLDVKNCFLYEILFNSHLERPLFTDELIKKTIDRWSNWCTWNDKDIKMHLCVHKIERFQHLKDSTSSAFLANAKIQYKGIKGKFSKKAVGLKQMKLVIYQKPESTSECYSWNLEDITVYIGTMLPKKSLPSNCTHFLTFVVNGEDLSNTSSRAFGHCLGFDSENEMLRWAASIYKTQHPNSF